MTGEGSGQKILVDTNIVIYAWDQNEQAKRTRASRLLKTLAAQQTLVISTQVLNEAFATLTRAPRGLRLAHIDAVQIIHDLARISVVLPLNATHTLLAVDAVSRHGLSFWDALIWAVAKAADIPTIYSEDFQHGRQIEGVQFIDPFAAAQP